MAVQLAKTFKGYVLLVDYGPISNCSFERSVKEIVPSVAFYVANMISVFRLNPRKIELIGHSLGAHVAGKLIRTDPTIIGKTKHSDVKLILL